MSLDAMAAPVITAAPRKRREWVFYLFLGILAIVVIAAILAPWVSPYDAAATDFAAIWQPPSASHLLGTDQLGRDLLSRIIHGARPTLLGSIALLFLATVLGVLMGVTAAWKRGWVDSFITRITDVMFAFPGVMFVILVIAVFESGATTAIIGMAMAYAPAIAKFTRAVALEEMARPYVDSYRLQGVGGFTLCVRYLLPNMLPTLVGYLVVLFGEGLMSLASLNFLGFGSQPPSSDWGLMVEESRAGVIQGILGPAIVPGLAIALVVVATNVVGVRLSDKLAVRK
jgi:peptide/nickel transport system permease protein